MGKVYKPVNGIRQELGLCLLSLIRPAKRAGHSFLFDVSVQHGQQIFQTEKVVLSYCDVCCSGQKVK